MEPKQYEIKDVINNTDWNYARENYQFVGKETCKIFVNGRFQYYEVDLYKLPNDEIKPYIVKKVAKKQIDLDSMRHGVARSIQSVKNAFSNLKESTTAENRDKYLRQLNHLVVALKKEAKNKTNLWTDLEVALELKKCEMEMFPEFSEMYTHSLTAWMNEIIDETESCDEEILTVKNSQTLDELN